MKKVEGVSIVGAVIGVLAAASIAVGCGESQKAAKLHASGTKSAIASVPKVFDQSGQLVRVADFGRCLDRSREAGGWIVTREQRRRAYDGLTQNAGSFELSWAGRWKVAGGRIETNAWAVAMVFPTTAAAAEFRKNYPVKDVVEGQLATSSFNVFVLAHDGQVEPAIPPRGLRGIHNCVRGSVGIVVTHEGIGKFLPCSLPHRFTDQKGFIFDRLHARGMTCGKALQLLARMNSISVPFCKALNPDYKCLMQHVCCSIFAFYAYGKDGEFMVRAG